MFKKFTKHNNKLSFIINKPLLNLLHVNSETQLKITTNGQLLIVFPLKDDEGKSIFKRRLECTNQKFGSVFKRLAN
jgi:antitoxin MazE